MDKGQKWIRKDPDDVLIVEDLKTVDGSCITLHYNIPKNYITEKRYNIATRNVQYSVLLSYDDFLKAVQASKYGEIGQDLVDEINLYRTGEIK